MFSRQYKCLRHLKGIKLKYQNVYVYQKAKPSLLVVGIEPRSLVWKGNTLLEEPLQDYILVDIFLTIIIRRPASALLDK